MSVMFERDDEISFDYLWIFCEHTRKDKLFLAMFGPGHIYLCWRFLHWICFLDYCGERGWSILPHTWLSGLDP